MKRWYQSNTVRALMVSAIAHLLVLTGVTEMEASEQASDLWEAAVGLFTLLVPVIGLLADYVGYRGRRNAEGPLE